MQILNQIKDFLSPALVVPICLGVAGLVLVLARTAPSEKEETGGGDITGSLAAALLLGAMVWRFGALFIMARSGMIVFEVDEVVRWDISHTWSRHPFFFTSWDGIWLSGNFAYFGLWMRLFGDPLGGTMAGILFQNGLTIFGAFFLAWSLSGSLWVGSLSAWLIAPGFPFLWIGQGVLVEGILAAYFMIALAFLWRFACSEENRPGEQWFFASGAALFLFLTASLHYNAWLAIIAILGPFLVLLWARRERIGWNGLRAAGLILVGSAAFPLLWMAFSWKTFGDPLQFLKNQHAFNVQVAQNLEHGFPDYLLQNLKILARQTVLICPVLICGAFLRRRDHFRTWIAFCALSAAVFLLPLVTGYASGNRILRDRYTILPYSCLLACIALSCRPIQAAWHGAGSGRAVRRCWIALCFAMILVPWFRYNAKMTGRFHGYSSTQEWPHDAFALSTWLRREFQNPHIEGFEDKKVRIGFRARSSSAEWLNFLGYMTGHRGNLEALATESVNSGQADPALGYVIFDEEGPIKGFEEIMRFGQWRVLERRQTSRP